MDVRRLSSDETELAEVVAFMVRLNRDASHHIGYCDEDEAALMRSFARFEVPPEDTFVVARDQGGIRGVLGFDADTALGRAWAYGPFVDHNEATQIADHLWAASVDLLPARVSEVELFFDVRNKTCESFAAAHSFTSYKNVSLLSLRRDDWMASARSKHEVRDFREEFFDDLVTLHDEAFPATYWSAAQMVTRTDEHHRVLIVADGERLQGYLHAEVDPEMEQGSIEFLAVVPEGRRRGVAESLVGKAVEWMFSFAPTTEIFLVLDEDNVAAARLYERLGWRTIRHMHSFRKKI